MQAILNCLGFTKNQIMKISASRMATILLIMALCLLTLAEAMGAQGAWAWLKAGSEAAAVGAFADWFAVVVLFRHPLGIKLPHTAIIPNSKDRIAESMANFVNDHFLQPNQLLLKLKQLDVSQQVSNYLLQDQQRLQLVLQLQAMMLEMIHQLDDESIKKALIDSFTHLAKRWNAAASLEQVLDLITKDNRHQEVLSMGLEKVANVLENPKVHLFMAQKIDELVKKEYPKIYVLLDTFSSVDNLSHSVANRLSQNLIEYLQAILNNPLHPQRAEFTDWLDQYLVSLKRDQQVQNQLNEIKDQWLQSPIVLEFLASIWLDLKSRISSDLSSTSSTIAHYANRSLQVLAERLAKDPGLSQAINLYLEKLVAENASHLSQTIKQHISSTIKAWDDEQLVKELERNVGRDLQFIRINGTLVGAAIGLGFYALSYAWKYLVF